MASRESDYLERATEVWEEYRFYIIAGILMVLATITGFTWQSSDFESEKKKQNEALFLILSAAENANYEEGKEYYQEMQSTDDFIELRHLASFALASLSFTNSENNEAEEVLQAVIKDSNDLGMQRLAALRLSEIYLNQDKYDQAESVLIENEPNSGRLLILFKERMGDIFFKQKKFDKAKSLYQESLVLSREEASFYIPVINIKISALLSKITSKK